MKLITAIAATTLTVSSVNAAAHDGHHGAGFLSTIWHLFSQPSHWFVLLGAAIIIGLTTAWVGKKRHSRRTIDSSNS